MAWCNATACFIFSILKIRNTTILQWGVAEQEQLHYFLGNIRRRGCDTFLDIGANFGTYTGCVNAMKSEGYRLLNRIAEDHYFAKDSLT
jgi:hypothetical protein